MSKPITQEAYDRMVADRYQPDRIPELRQHVLDKVGHLLPDNFKTIGEAEEAYRMACKFAGSCPSNDEDGGRRPAAWAYAWALQGYPAATLDCITYALLCEKEKL